MRLITMYAMQLHILPISCLLSSSGIAGSIFHQHKKALKSPELLDVFMWQLFALCTLVVHVQSVVRCASLVSIRDMY